MALLRCESCELTVSMKRIDAKAHGWTVREIPLASISCRRVEEIWICPTCGSKKWSAA